MVICNFMFSYLSLSAWISVMSLSTYFWFAIWNHSGNNLRFRFLLFSYTCLCEISHIATVMSLICTTRPRNAIDMHTNVNILLIIRLSCCYDIIHWQSILYILLTCITMCMLLIIHSVAVLTSICTCHHICAVGMHTCVKMLLIIHLSYCCDFSIHISYWLPILYMLLTCILVWLWILDYHQSYCYNSPMLNSYWLSIFTCYGHTYISMYTWSVNPTDPRYTSILVPSVCALDQFIWSSSHASLIKSCQQFHLSQQANSSLYHFLKVGLIWVVLLLACFSTCIKWASIDFPIHQRKAQVYVSAQSFASPSISFIPKKALNSLPTQKKSLGENRLFLLPISKI